MSIPNKAYWYKSFAYYTLTKYGKIFEEIIEENLQVSIIFCIFVL